jgi:uncharacterized membrane protein (UPF0127 family)
MNRKTQIITVIILGIFFSLICWLAFKIYEPPINKIDQISIGGHIWRVEIADNDQEREQGLSGRANLDKNNGLLFVFDQEEYHSFWMKDMLMPIDMIFLDKDWRIVLIESNLSPASFPKMFGNAVKSQYVLEVNANEAISYNLKVGDRAIFINK